MLREFDAEQFAGQVLQSVPVGVGAHELGGNFRAIYGPCLDIQILLENGNVETRAMEDLEDTGVGEQCLQVRGSVVAGVELHEVGAAVPPTAARGRAGRGAG